MVSPPPPYGLVVFDLDGTILALQEPIWKTLHQHFGSDPDRRRRAIARARSGEISYQEWFAEDLAMLRERGVTRSALQALGRDLPVTPGAVALIQDLRASGVFVGILSGGLDVIRRAALPDLTVDAEHINSVQFRADGTISGGVHTPYDGAAKGEGLRRLADRFTVDMSRVAFVGDGPNDVSAAGVAALSVAWGQAAPALVQASTVAIADKSMAALRPLLLPAEIS